MARSFRRQPSGLTRPVPPPSIQEEADRGDGVFLPAPELCAWARSVFLDPASPLFDEVHSDLEPARIGFLWTSEVNLRGGEKLILGTAELARPPLGVTGWQAARYRYQVREWFGSWWEGEPADFIITVYAPRFATLDDASALAGVKHELLHCRQKVDGYGEPRFNSVTGAPIWGIRPHDVEIFVAEVEWFGADALDGGARRLVEAAAKRPKAGVVAQNWACGTCERRAA